MGVPLLDAGKSRNFTIGLGVKPDNNTSFTLALDSSTSGLDDVFSRRKRPCWAWTWSLATFTTSRLSSTLRSHLAQTSKNMRRLRASCSARNPGLAPLINPMVA